MTEWLNIACSGKFHYMYYAKHLPPGVLKKIYFSHKLGTSGDLDANFRNNIFIKEYLTGGHLRLFGEFGIVDGMSLYNKIWEFQLNKIFSVAPINLFLLHGNCLGVMRKARAGGLVVGEAVNAHPDVVWERLRAEAECIGLPLRPPGHAVARIKQEIEELDYLLCPSIAVSDSFVERGFDASRIIVLPYGVEKNALFDNGHERKIVANDRVTKIRSILCVGQITLRKGQLRLLNLIKSYFDKIDKPYPHVKFIGRADPAYLKLMEGHSVPFSVERHVAHHELMKKFSEFDVFCLASLEDGFAMVILEAAASGVPVVSSRYAGASELIKSVDGCEVFDPFVDDDFGRALEKVAGKKVALDLNENSWESYAIKLSNSLNSLLQK